MFPAFETSLSDPSPGGSGILERAAFEFYPCMGYREHVRNLRACLSEKTAEKIASEERTELDGCTRFSYYSVRQPPLKTSFFQLYITRCIDRISINLSLFISCFLVVILSHTRYIYIYTSFSVDDSRANFLAFLFLFRADPENFGGGFRDSKPPCMWPVQGCRDNTRSAMLVTFVYSWSAGLLYAGLPRL